MSEGIYLGILINHYLIKIKKIAKSTTIYTITKTSTTNARRMSAWRMYDNSIFFPFIFFFLPSKMIKKTRGRSGWCMMIAESVARGEELAQAHRATQGGVVGVCLLEGREATAAPKCGVQLPAFSFPAYFCFYLYVSFILLFFCVFFFYMSRTWLFVIFLKVSLYLVDFFSCYLIHMLFEVR